MRPALGVALGVALALVTCPPAALAVETPCAEVQQKTADAAALKPSEVLLAVSTPRAGETILVAAPNDTVTFAIDYWGPPLKGSSEARVIDDYHLVYFLDEDATPFVGTMLPIPRCNPHILHSVATRVTFDRVDHGSHTLSVVLSGSNNVSVNPPVAARVWFLVR
jgi:hypothetical protein